MIQIIRQMHSVVPWLLMALLQAGNSSCSSTQQGQNGENSNQLQSENTEGDSENVEANAQLQDGDSADQEQGNEFDNAGPNDDAITDEDSVQENPFATGQEDPLADGPEPSVGNPSANLLGTNSAQPVNSAANSAGNPAPIPEVAAPAPPTVQPAVAVPAPKGPLETTLTTKSPDDLPSFDILPAQSLLWWVGYDFQAQQKIVRIEMVTRGSPLYDLFQEKNRAGQPELIVRFYETALRPKLRRNIDASEFRSPVAYVRMRHNATDESVDVILTLRDSTMPRMYARSGSVLLTFPIPEKYNGNVIPVAPPAGEAQLLTAAEIKPVLIGGSDTPKSMKIQAAPNPADGVFTSVPPDGGAEVQEIQATNVGNIDSQDVAPEAIDASLTNNLNQLNEQGIPEETNNGSDLPNNQVDESGGDAQENIPANEQQNGNPANEQPANNDEQFENQNQNFEDDKLDDFDDGEGDSETDDEKFEVRSFPDKYRITRFALASVAQDNGQEDFANDFDNEASGDLESKDSEAISSNQVNGGDDSLPNGENGANGGNVGQSGSTNDLDSGEVADQVDTSNLNSELQNAGVGDVGDQNIFANDAADPVPVQSSPPGSNGTIAASPGNPAPSVTPIAEAVDVSGPETVGQDTGSEPVSTQEYKPVRLEFRGAKLKEVIRALGDENHVNFTFPAEIGESLVFMNFKDVPWDSALRAVLETNGLGMVKLDGGVVRIDTLAKLTAEKDELFRIRESAARLIPTKVLVLRLSYADAEEVKKLIDNMLTSAKTDKRVRVETDKRTNSVVVEATPGDLSKVKALVDRIDLQTPQVQIASRIVEVLRTGAHLFGIDWAGPLLVDQGRGLNFGNIVFPNNILSSFAVDTGALSNAQTQSGINAHIGSVNNSLELDLRLRLEESKGTTHILQNNNLIVEDNSKATIQAGKQDFFAVQAAEGQPPGFTTVDYLLQLEVTPHITADGAVQMNLKIESSSPITKVSPDAEGSRSQRLLQTSLLKNSGETAAIGGLYTTEKQDQYFGLPILSDIPIIGALFRTKVQKDDRRELIILVTPTILAGAKPGSGGESVSSSSEAVGGNFGTSGALNTSGNVSSNQVNANETDSEEEANQQQGNQQQGIQQQNQQQGNQQQQSNQGGEAGNQENSQNGFQQQSQQSGSNSQNQGNNSEANL